jgi:hypothetical protein
LISDCKKHFLWKLNKILYKLNTIENKLDILQEKGQSSNQSCNIAEIDNLFPICTISDLKSFEEQLEEKNFQNDVVCTTDTEYVSNLVSTINTICIIKSNTKVLHFLQCVIK